MAKKMLENELFRTDISYGSIGVDREKGIIRGFGVVTEGIVKDRRGEFDEAELDHIMTLGNSSKKGIKSRYGHPNMSTTALGTFLGRVKNFRKDGKLLRGDLIIDKTAYNTPDGDLATYVMDLAESDPEAFGSSMVIKWEPEARFDKKGNPERDKDGAELPPFMRVEKFWAVDIVDDPAANSGMFGMPFFNNGVMPAASMTSFLNKFLDNPDAVEKALIFLERYALNRNELKESNERTIIKVQTDFLNDLARMKVPDSKIEVIKGVLTNLDKQDLEKMGGEIMANEKEKKEQLEENVDKKVDEVAEGAEKTEGEKEAKAEGVEKKEEAKAEDKDKNAEKKVDEGVKAEIADSGEPAKDAALEKTYGRKEVDAMISEKNKTITKLESDIVNLNEKIRSMDADAEVSKQWSEKYSNIFDKNEETAIKGILRKTVLGQPLNLEEIDIISTKKSDSLPGATTVIDPGELTEAQKTELRKLGGLKAVKA